MGDDVNEPKRRRRPINRPQVPPGSLRDLKDFLYELYLRADTPTLDTIEAWIAADDDLAGAPDRATVNRIIGEPKLPPSQVDVVAVPMVLARAAAMDPADIARTARELWRAAWMSPVVGKPLAEVADPFALEVHRPIALDNAQGLPVLPPYVRRPHDEQLADVVGRALGGASAMAVLVAGSSAGKTRSCWEVLEPLRSAGGWRLWHPYDPTRPEAALEALHQVGPRTVVWLNETQAYLKGDHGERVAAKLRSLLSDEGRAPVLVLGTLWPKFHAELTSEQGSQVQLVLDGTVIEVPEAFSSAEVASLRESAAADVRLAWAAEHADDGQITQCLAGGPALLERFYAVDAPAKAFIQVAMDAVRMGHYNAIPRELLENAAAAYLTDAQFNELEGNWAEKALAEISAPCKGALGPVTRIPARVKGRGRRTGRARQSEAAEPLYRLADYLDQYSRAHRADLIPPIEFWAAAVSSAKPESLNSLATSAWDRGLYRDAVALNKRATNLGNAFAAVQLVERMHGLHPGDLRVAEWAVAQVRLGSPHSVGMLMDTLRTTGAEDSLRTLASNVAAGFDLRSGGLGYLLKKLAQLGSRAQVDKLLARDPVSVVPLENASEVKVLFEALREVGAIEQVESLLARDPASQVQVDVSLGDVAGLIALLHEMGIPGQVNRLAARAAAEAPLSGSYFVSVLLEKLREADCTDEVAALLDRDPATQVALDQFSGVDRLLVELDKLGAHEQIAVLARRAAAELPLVDASRIARLLQTLAAVGRGEDVATLLARDPASRVPVDSGIGVKLLLSQLIDAGARAQVATLAERAAATVPVTESYQVTLLLDVLCGIRAHSAVKTLLSRNIASKIEITRSYSGWSLLGRLDKLGAREQLAELGTRIVNGNSPVDSGSLAYTLETLASVGLASQVGVLISRRPAETITLGSPGSVATLLHKLHDLGANEQVDVLATRAASGVPLRDPLSVDLLLDRFDELRLTTQLVTLLARRPSSCVAVDGGTGGIRVLLQTLRRLGQDDQVFELAQRAVAEVGAGELGSRQLKLLAILVEFTAVEEIIAPLRQKPLGRVNIADPAEVHSVLSALRTIGGEVEIESILVQDPAAQVKLGKPYDVAKLLETLQSLDAEDQVETLAARAAASVALQNSFDVGVLLDRLATVGAVDDVAVLLARDPARQVTVDSSHGVKLLLEQLQRLGNEGQVAVFAEHIVANAPLGKPDTVAELVEVLRAAGAVDQATALQARVKASYLSDEEWNPSFLAGLKLADSANEVTLVDLLPAAGKFGRFLEVGDHATRFRFGREPDGSPALRWTWDDLADDD